jgi:hypothetical protein
VTASEKKAILAAYGYAANTERSTGEFDHWFPHWMGGSDGPKNIWFEPHAGNFGSFAKAKVERLLWREVCVDKTNDSRSGEGTLLEGMDKTTSPTLRLSTRSLRLRKARIMKIHKAGLCKSDHS